MADRGHADGDQVLGRQVRQDVSVDEIVAERWLVLLKAELLEPTRDIYRHYEALMVICQPVASGLGGETQRLPIAPRQQ